MALTPRSRRSSRAPPAGAVDPAREAAAAVATVAAAAAALAEEKEKETPPPGHLLAAHVPAFLILAALWCVLTGLQVLRARSPKCSPAWSGAIGAQVAFAALCSVLLGARAMRRARARASAGGGACEGQSNVRTPGRLVLACLGAVLGGLIGGLLGLGGGILIGPLLLALRLPPPVAAATSTLLVLFSSSSAVAAVAATPGALSPLYVAAFAPVAAVAGLVGVVAAARYVKASGRESLLVFLLAAVVAAGAVLTAAVSGPNAVAQVRSGQSGLKGVCG